MDQSHVFTLVLTLCVCVVVSASELTEGKTMPGRFDLEELSDNLKKAFNSPGDAAKSLVKEAAEAALGSQTGGTPGDEFGGIIDDAIDGIVDDAIDDALEGIGLDKDLTDGVKNVLSDVISDEPGSLSEDSDKNSSSNDTTPKADSRDRIVEIFLSPILAFAERFGDVTTKMDGGYDRLRSWEGLLSRLESSQRAANVSKTSGSPTDGRLALSVIDLVSNLTASDIRFLERIENNRTRKLVERYVTATLPTLVDVLFGRASVDDLRCIITNNVMKDTFSFFFGSSEISRPVTEIVLSITGCGDTPADISNENSVDQPAVNAMTRLLTSREENDVDAVSLITDLLSFANPSITDPLQILQQASDQLTSLAEDSPVASQSVSQTFLSNSAIANALDAILPQSEDEGQRAAEEYVSILLSRLLEPVLEPLPLNDEQKTALATSLGKAAAPIATSAADRVSDRVLSNVVPGILQSFGLSEQQADYVIEQLRNLDLGGSDGSSNASSTLLNLLGSDSAQEIFRTLAQNSSLSALVPRDLASSLGVLSVLEQVFRTLSRIYSDSYQTTQRCSLERAAIGAGIQTVQPWALKFVDSMGKPGVGIMEGNSYFVGDFDQCTGIYHRTGTRDSIKGVYAKYVFKVPLPDGVPAAGGAVRFQEGGLPYVVWGVCFPEGCDSHDVQAVGKGVADGLNVKLVTADILNRRTPHGDTAYLLSMMAIGALVVCCFAGTLLDLLLKNDVEAETEDRIPAAGSPSSPEGRPGSSSGTILSRRFVGAPIPQARPSADGMESRSPTAESVNRSATFRELRANPGTVQSTQSSPGFLKLVLSFSIPYNVSQILSARHSPGEITCLHGIRVISITWVILGHSYLFAPEYANLLVLLDMSKWWTFNAIYNATYSVDTFFVLSGCLVSYLFLKSAKRSGVTTKSMILYYIYRYLRLTPLLVLAMIFYANVSPYLEYGPFQSHPYDREPICKDRWWWNVLYINNLFSESEMCMGWSWYLPNDMQFFAVAPLVLVPLALGYRLIGLLVAGIQIGIHIIMYTYLEEKYNGTLFKNSYAYFTYIYIKPYSRCAPYAIGLIMGYVLFKTKLKFRMQWAFALLGWLVAAAAGLVLVYITHDNYKDNGVVKPAWSVSSSNAYEIAVRPLWACCVAWVIFACSTGNGGVVNQILSWRAWIPLSRLTYGTYLFHVMVMHYFNNNARFLHYFTKEFVIERYLSVIMLSFGMAFVASLLIETPVRNMTRPWPASRTRALRRQRQPQSQAGPTGQHTATKSPFGSAVPAMFGSNPYTALDCSSQDPSSPTDLGPLHPDLLRVNASTSPPILTTENEKGTSHSDQPLQPTAPKNNSSHLQSHGQEEGVSVNASPSDGPPSVYPNLAFVSEENH